MATMKQLISYLIAFLSISSLPMHLGAQTPPEPGQLAAVSTTHPGLALTPVVTSGAPGVSMANVSDRDGKSNKLWVGSIFALIGGSAADAATSWGKYESNPLLASSNGRFGARGLSFKMGLTGAAIVPQILLRKHQQSKTRFAVFNFVGAGAFTGIAIHNLGVAAPKN